MDYKASGVDIDAGNEVVRRIRSLARGTFTSGVLSDIGSFGGLFHLGRVARCRCRARRERRRRRDQAARRLHDRRRTHDRRRSRQSLRQRHPRPGRRAAVLPRLPRDRPARSGCGRADRRRPRRGLPRRTAARCSAARPRRCPASTRTASTTSPASSSGIVARDATDRRQPHRAGRRADRAAVVRAAHQRLLAGPPDCIRRRRARRSSSLVPGSDMSIGEALLVPHRSYLPVDPAAACVWGDQGHGAHHRRRHHREPAARPAGGHAGRDRSIRMAGPADLRMAPAGWRGPDDDMLRTFNMGIGLILAVGGE